MVSLPSLMFFSFSYGGSIQSDNLKLLLELTLARGNIKSIFRVFKVMHGKLNVDKEQFHLSPFRDSRITVESSSRVRRPIWRYWCQDFTPSKTTQTANKAMPRKELWAISSVTVGRKLELSPHLIFNWLKIHFFFT